VFKQDKPYYANACSSLGCNHALVVLLYAGWHIIGLALAAQVSASNRI
jgi:hypothetical protein